MRRLSPVYYSFGAMRGALTIAVRDMNRVGMTAAAARWVTSRGCQTGKESTGQASAGVALTSNEATKPQVAGSHLDSQC
jgi:hypothetical protein